jgi:hypothetical protein
MTPFTRKAGSALLLVLALAPGLCAGTTASRILVAAGGVAAIALGTQADLVTAASVVPGAPVPSQAKGLETPFGLVTFRPMGYLCPGPRLQPHRDSDLEVVDKLVEEALQAYQDAGCEPLIAEKALCVGPDAWEPPAKTRKMDPKAYITARLQNKPDNTDADRHALQGQVDDWALGLEEVVCRALGDFQRDRTEGRHAAVFQRFLEAGDLHARLLETQARAAELHELALRNLAAEEMNKRARLNMARAKLRLAGKAGRLASARAAETEARPLQAALEDAQYEVDAMSNILGRCNGAVGRFTAHIWPILDAMGPGSLQVAEPEAEQAPDPSDD